MPVRGRGPRTRSSSAAPRDVGGRAGLAAAVPAPGRSSSSAATLARASRGCWPRSPRCCTSRAPPCCWAAASRTWPALPAVHRSPRAAARPAAAARFPLQPDSAAMLRRLTPTGSPPGRSDRARRGRRRPPPAVRRGRGAAARRGATAARAACSRTCTGPQHRPAAARLPGRADGRSRILLLATHRTTAPDRTRPHARDRPAVPAGRRTTARPGRAQRRRHRRLPHPGERSASAGRARTPPCCATRPAATRSSCASCGATWRARTRSLARGPADCRPGPWCPRTGFRQGHVAAALVPSGSGRPGRGGDGGGPRGWR